MKKLKDRLIVLVDLDNVLNNFTEVILTHYNADHNTSHKLEDVKVYSMEDSLGIPFNTLYQYFISPDIILLLFNCHSERNTVKSKNLAMFRLRST